MSPATQYLMEGLSWCGLVLALCLVSGGAIGLILQLFMWLAGGEDDDQGIR
jgi:hypothetical protein